MNKYLYQLLNRLRSNFWRGWFQVQMARLMSATFGGVAFTSQLSAIHLRLAPDDLITFNAMREKALDIQDEYESRLILQEAERWAWSRGHKTNLGVLSYRVVTNAFVNFVVDQLQTETSVFGDFKYHDSGVGTTAEAAGDTGIETTDGESRATGTQTESAANAYRSVGTISYTTTKAITEHMLFNDPTAGTGMDRSVFSAINVVNLDSIQFTYTLTLTSGG